MHTLEKILDVTYMATRKRKELLSIEEYMETSIQKGIFGEAQSPWTGRHMGRKRRFYYFLIRGTNSKEIRY